MARRNEPGMRAQRDRPQSVDDGMASEHRSNGHPASSGDAVPQRSGLISEAFAGMMLRDDGWLRIVPHEDGSVCYFKWKFSRGQWRGHYIMYRCDDFNYAGALEGLYHKLSQVDAGDRRPSLDHPYGD